jgi:hypothetical protein
MKSDLTFDEYSDFDTDSELLISSEFILDGASTLEDAAEMARNYADYLEDLANEGYELMGTISQGKGHITLEPVEVEESIY